MSDEKVLAVISDQLNQVVPNIAAITENLSRLLWSVTIPEMPSKGSLVSGSVRPYSIHQYSLTGARTDERLLLSGSFLHAWTDGDLENIGVRLNLRQADILYLKRRNPMSLPFYEVYLTNDAQAGKTLDLLVGTHGLVDVSNQELIVTMANLDVALSSIATIMGEVQASPTADTMLDRLKDVATILGEVQASPTANTVLDRLKDLLSVPVLMDAPILNPFGQGLLTESGVQYSAEHETSTDDFEAVETVAVSNPTGYSLIQVDFGLTMAIRSSGAAEDVIWKWQASDDGSSWEDLISAVTETTPGAVSADKSCSGVFAPTGNFLGTGSTFQVRAMVKSGSAGGETAKGKTKTTSWVQCKYEAA